MEPRASWVVVGLDNGGTSNNATVLDAGGRFLVDSLVETPSAVRDGPEDAVDALAAALDHILEVTGTPRTAVRAVGLDTPGPATATGVISSTGGVNFGHSDWRGFDVRAALEKRLGLPVVYNNDGNAAALYAHHRYFGAGGRPPLVGLRDRRHRARRRRGRGRPGGQRRGRHGRRARARAHPDGRAARAEASRCPCCNCGFVGDAESVASLTGIENNLLPYWLDPLPRPRAGRRRPIGKAAKLVRGYAENGDPLALKIFEQQAMALGRPVHHRGELHRPGRLLRRRRRGRDGAALPRLVPRQGARSTRRCARSSEQVATLRAGARPRHGGRPRRGHRRARERPRDPRGVDRLTRDQDAAQRPTSGRVVRVGVLRRSGRGW